MSLVKGVVINDLHFGITDSQRLYNELDIFKKYLEEHKDVQFLVIDGDYFDHKLSVVDPATYLAVTFFHELITICKKQKIIVRMVQGTRGHELNQLQIFDAYQNDSELNFKIVLTAQEENLLGMHILYLPEEYPEDSEAYYAKFKAKDKQYNIIFGHGTWDFVAFESQIEHGKQTNTHSAPVFIWKEWQHTIPDGFISFGHIHSRNIYGKKIFYSGSFTRWNHVERSARGFTHFEYDTDAKTYNVEFVDNNLAPKFDEVAISNLVNLDLNQDIKKIQTALEEAIAATDYLAIDISGLNKENKAIIKKLYGSNNHIKLEEKTKGSVLKESSAANAEEFKKYHYITKRQLSLEETVKRFAEEDLKKTIEVDKIKEVLKEEK